MDIKLQTKTACRVCESPNLTEILSLGSLHISDFVESQKKTVKAPLDLVICNSEKGGCSLVQLKHTAVDPDILYRNYWYKSGINKTMRGALADITEKAEKLLMLQDGDIVLDIGANDGTLLRTYRTKGIKRIGFEPAKNLTKEAKRGTDLIIADFFGFKAFKRKVGKKAKIITTIAMFYDLEHPNSFVSDIRKSLDTEGVWINQMAYQLLMLQLNAFDNICHEHIEYYSLLSLQNLLDRHQLEIFDVELNDVNGGSFRTYVRHKKDRTIKPFAGAKQRIKDLQKQEEKLGINKMEIYRTFTKKVEALKRKTVSFIKGEVKKGKKIYVYGASTKGNTLLQYFGLDHKLITAAADRNQDKWRLKTVGTLIPIISEEEARGAKPDYFLVLPWHFKKEFIEREKEYLRNGGAMIFPLPEFEVVRGGA